MTKAIMFTGCTVLFLVQATPAHAYLDPGTGSIILQALIGIVASVGVALKVYWEKIRQLRSKFFGNGQSEK